MRIVRTGKVRVCHLWGPSHRPAFRRHRQSGAVVEQSPQWPSLDVCPLPDLPVRERREIVRELRYMGITAGSLFPGLDGACEELTDRNFEI